MSDHRLDEVERACRELATSGAPVTFIAVSERSGIPRVTLYRNPTLRAVLEEQRSHSQGATTSSGLAAQLANQGLALEALADRVRRHEELLRRLSEKA